MSWKEKKLKPIQDIESLDISDLEDRTIYLDKAQKKIIYFHLEERSGEVVLKVFCDRGTLSIEPHSNNAIMIKVVRE